MTTMRTRALEILRTNDRGEFSVPTHGLYPVQFNWDSAFAALGYRFIDIARAWREMELLTEAQWPDGMIPHIIFRGDHEGYFPGPDTWQAIYTPPTSGITQPPVLATLARRLWETSEGLEAPRMHTLLQRIERWHAWFQTARLETETQAIFIVHPWESGRDNLSDWDAGMARVQIADIGPYQRRDLEHVDAAQRPTKEEYDKYLTIVKHGGDLTWDQVSFGQTSPFRMVDPGMTAMLLRAERDLAWLQQRFGLENTETQKRIKILEAGWRALWNEKIQAFTAYDPVEQCPVNSISAASFLGPYAGIEDYLGPTMDHFDRIAAKVAFMVPSFDLDHEAFNPKRYWRGPVWHVINSRIGLGLAEVGETARAERIRVDTQRLSETNDFFEYYNPLNGEGLGGRNFTWTASVYLDWVLDGKDPS